MQVYDKAKKKNGNDFIDEHLEKKFTCQTN